LLFYVFNFEIWIYSFSYLIASISNDNVTARNKNNGNLLDGFDFKTANSTDKTASTNEISNLSISSAGNKTQNLTANNIFDTLGDVFAKNNSPNSNLN